MYDVRRVDVCCVRRQHTYEHMRRGERNIGDASILFYLVESTERHGTPFQVFLHTLRAFVLLHKFTVAAVITAHNRHEKRSEENPT